MYFNERGVSVVSQDERVLWHKDISDFKTVKDSEKTIERHRYELEVQTLTRMF